MLLRRKETDANAVYIHVIVCTFIHITHVELYPCKSDVVRVARVNPSTETASRPSEKCMCVPRGRPCCVLALRLYSRMRRGVRVEGSDAVFVVGPAGRLAESDCEGAAVCLCFERPSRGNANASLQCWRTQAESSFQQASLHHLVSGAWKCASCTQR